MYGNRVGPFLLCTAVAGCNVDPLPCQSVFEGREAVPPGTKIAKGQSKELCECETVANEFSVCCNGCPFGDAVECRSSTVFDSNGIGVDVCAGHVDEPIPDPACSLRDDSIVAIPGYPPVTGPILPARGLIPFQWGWFNPHPTELPPTANLILIGALAGELSFRGLHDLTGTERVVAVAWESSIPSCDAELEAQDLFLDETGFWGLWLDGLPGYDQGPVVPSYQVF